jgi:aromatic ring-cleaving dioxygenase
MISLPLGIADKVGTAHPVTIETVVSWLMMNREGLDVLVHPLTDNSYDDHSRYAVWLGSPVALKLNRMRRTYRTEQYPTPH